jgi:hypothetical protein
MTLKQPASDFLLLGHARPSKRNRRFQDGFPMQTPCFQGVAFTWGVTEYETLAEKTQKNGGGMQNKRQGAAAAEPRKRPVVKGLRCRHGARLRVTIYE